MSPVALMVQTIHAIVSRFLRWPCYEHVTFLNHWDIPADTIPHILLSFHLSFQSPIQPAYAVVAIIRFAAGSLLLTVLRLNRTFKGEY